jgi:hypothetical protein
LVAPASRAGRSRIAPEDREATVAAWIAAFNGRDRKRMLPPLDREVVMHPLRLAGLEPLYRGHAGIREWLDALARNGYAHRVNLSEIQAVREQTLLAIGSLAFHEHARDVPFSGLYEFAGSKLVSIHHYYTHHETLRQIVTIEQSIDGGTGRDDS